MVKAKCAGKWSENGFQAEKTMNQVKRTASLGMCLIFLMVVALMLDCQCRMKVLFSQEIGEYMISAFCILYTDICFTKPQSLGQENIRTILCQNTDDCHYLYKDFFRVSQGPK